MDVIKLLDTLAGLPGVQATTVFEIDGGGRAMRALDGLGESLVGRASDRAAALLVALEQLGAAGEECALRFDGGWVLLMRSGQHGAMVVADERASLNSTRMMVKTLVRHLGNLRLAGAGGERDAAPSLEAVTAGPGPKHAAIEAARGAPVRKARMYRGQAY
ncbi:MAG: hypothetical protein ACK4KV_06095 [Rhodocyclaceae bacterium]